MHDVTIESPRLDPLTRADFPTARALAHEIWREHYVPMIGEAQVEYMLQGRYTDERLSLYIGATDKWFRLLRTEGTACGYCSYSVTSADEMKLEQLYLRSTQKGRGLGGLMMRHVEAAARAAGMKRIMLTVNRHNTGSIAIYKKSGFVVREEAVFDIGNGYFMDDYVMVKAL